jgi:hypothetical protein
MGNLQHQSDADAINSGKITHKGKSRCFRRRVINYLSSRRTTRSINQAEWCSERAQQKQFQSSKLKIAAHIEPEREEKREREPRPNKSKAHVSIAIYFISRDEGTFYSPSITPSAIINCIRAWRHVHFDSAAANAWFAAYLLPPPPFMYIRIESICIFDRTCS